MEDEKTVAKPGRRKKAVDGTGARASPKTQETKTSEIANQDKHESKSDLEVAEQVVLLPLDKLQPFKDHPFKVKDDDELMQDTIDSIMVGGVINPILVRPAQNGGFEVVSGHRRFRASQLAGLDKIKAIVREMDDDTAIITMVDSNLQRENILPSERAFSYKMKLEALRHQGKRPDLGEQSTSPQFGEKSSWAVSVVAEDAGSSRSQIQRFIRLTNLIPQLMEMVDNKELAFNPAVELSWLKPQEQKDFLEAMDYVLTLKGKMSHRVELGKDPRGNLVRIDNALAGMEGRLARVQEKLDSLYVQMETARTELGKPFPQEQELREKSARLAQLNIELNIDDQTPLEAMIDASEPTQDTRPAITAKTERTSVLAKLRAPLPQRDTHTKNETEKEER